ncbi:hypothetical protein G9A89_003706 [Geosiphon pyriformis]|nr:hypothetical protein G9A89_003706 [Geosiphon pyriformis]
MIQLWEDQPSRIKSSSDQTAKWMNGMVKNSHELVSIIGKMYELDMFDTLAASCDFCIIGSWSRFTAEEPKSMETDNV